MTIDLDTLTRSQRQHRMNVRNFLLIATPSELEAELKIGNCADRKRWVQELIDEQLQRDCDDNNISHGG